MPILGHDDMKLTQCVDVTDWVWDMIQIQIQILTSTRGGGRGSERSPSLGSAHQVSSRTITFKNNFQDLGFKRVTRVTLVPSCLVAGNRRSANSLVVITMIIFINMTIIILINMTMINFIANFIINWL